MLARKEHAPREFQRGIKIALEGGLEARGVDAEFPHQEFCNPTVERLRRLHRLAAAVAEDQAAIEAELVTLGVAAEIVMVVEDEDARPRNGAPIEPRGRKTADTAADHDEIVALRDGRCVDCEGLA